MFPNTFIFLFKGYRRLVQKEKNKRDGRNELKRIPEASS
jgi:hypothetical protein